MKKFLILIVLSVFNIVLCAQEQLNSSLFFKSVLSDALETKPSESTIIPSSFKAPIFEEFSFRTETRDLDFDKQEYQFRFDVSTRAKRKAQKELYQQYYTVLNQQINARETILIDVAYEDWIKLYFIDKKTKILQEKVQVLLDKKMVLEKKAMSLNLDHKQLLNTNRNLNAIKLSLYKSTLLKDEILEKYNLSQSIFSFDNIIKPEQISEMILMQISQNEELLNSEYALKNEMINKEIALEKAEQKEIFDFGQIKYQGPHDNLIQERIAIGAAINFNQSGNRKLKIAELELEKAELSYEKDKDRIKAQDKLNELSKAIHREILTLDKFSELEAIENNENRRLIELLNEKEGINPILILELKENEVETELERLDLERKIYEDYLEYLFSSNIIYKLPFRNYLKA